jgi:hypothetical protein
MIEIPEMDALRNLAYRLGLIRTSKWERPTVLESLLSSPLTYLTTIIFNMVLFLRGRPFNPPAGRTPIRVVCISDTHDQTVEVPDGDLLIHAGDMSSIGTAEAIQKQLDWLDSLPHARKVVVSGNHDSWFDPTARCQADRDAGRRLELRSLISLEHEMVTLEFSGGRKLNIYGAPDLPACGGPDNACVRPCVDSIPYSS